MPGQGREFSSHQRGIVNRYYEHLDTIALQKLGEIVSDLYLAQGSQATRLWNSARTALAKLAPADDPQVMKVLSVRSITGLAKLVTELNSAAKKARANAPPAALDPTVGDEPLATSVQPVSTVSRDATAAAASSAAPAAPPSADDLRHAMKAFRKRLKLTRLDEESKLGRTGNPMSGGKKSGVVAIMPPRDYPQAVWDELVRQGKLRRSGSFYELVEGV